MTVPKIYVVEHFPCETLGAIASILRERGISSRYIRVYRDVPVPARIGQAAGLILMGGPMGVYEQDRYPFLRQEMTLIEDALREEKPILGICLGSQLLAATLGAPVVKGARKEIGWHTVHLTARARRDRLWKGEPACFTPFHWHGDVFDLPRGGISLASSDLTRQQAFRYGLNAYGFLFHMEVTPKIIQQLVKAFPGELREAGVDRATLSQKTSGHVLPLQRIGRRVFGRWVDLLKEN